MESGIEESGIEESGIEESGIEESGIEWSQVAKFFVHGRAAPAGSKSAFRIGGRTVVAPASKYSKPWMEVIHYRCLEEFDEIILGAVFLVTEFVLQRPKAHHISSKRSNGLKAKFLDSDMLSVPDCTKLVRCVEDAMTGVVWKDDSQVIEQRNIKRYAGPGELPGVWITVLVRSGDDEVG